MLFKAGIVLIGFFLLSPFFIIKQVLEYIPLTNGVTHLDMLVISFFCFFFSNENNKVIGRSHSWDMKHTTHTQAPAFTVYFLAINNTMGGSENLNGAAGGSRSLGMALWLSYPSFFLFPLSASCPSLGNPCLPQMPTAMMLCPTTRGHRAKRSMAEASETLNPNKSFTLLSCLCDTSCHSDGKVQIFFITAGD